MYSVPLKTVTLPSTSRRQHTLPTSGGTIDSNASQDQVVYSVPLKTVTLPSTSRQQHTLPTKAVSNTSQEQPPSGDSSDVHEAKRDIQAVSGQYQ